MKVGEKLFSIQYSTIKYNELGFAQTGYFEIQVLLAQHHHNPEKEKKSQMRFRLFIYLLLNQSTLMSVVTVTTKFISQLLMCVLMPLPAQ